MAEVRQRRRSSTRSTSKPVSRRRDRARDDEPEDDDEEEETTSRSTRRRSTRSTSRTSSRRKAPVDEEEDDEDEEDEIDEDDDDEEEEPPRRTRSKSTSRSRSRSRRDDDEDDDEEEDDEPRSSRRGSSRSRSSSNRRSSSKRGAKKSSNSAAVRTGSAGVDEVREMVGGGPPRVKLAKTPVLVKLLDKNPPAVTFAQHWVNPGGGARSDRTYTCLGKRNDCPLCEMGARVSQSIVLNALVLSGVEEPTVKVIQTGIRGWNNLKDAAEENGKINVRKGFWAVNVSGKGTDAQTNFRPVKERDLEDDWEEIFENFEPDDLPDIIVDAEAELFGPEIVQKTSRSELRQLARHLADEDEEDEDDEEDD